MLQLIPNQAVRLQCPDAEKEAWSLRMPFVPDLILRSLKPHRDAVRTCLFTTKSSTPEI